MKVREVGVEEWRGMVLDALHSHPSLAGSTLRIAVELGDATVLLGARMREVCGVVLCESMGREVSGGPACLGEPSACSRASKMLPEVLEKVLARFCDACALTLRDYDPMHSKLVHALASRGWVVADHLYPRILPLHRYWGSPDSYVEDLPKKSRNRWRAFHKRGGKVLENPDPTRYAVDVFEALNSNPWRQGRAIPRSWRDPRAVARMLGGLRESVERGLASFYAAVMDGKLVGFAVVSKTRWQCLVSSFIVHKEYARHGVGSALIVEAVRRMAGRREALYLQYGYYRPVNPGINYFLDQHLFRPLRETLLVKAFSPRAAPLMAAYSAAVRVMERVRSRTAAALYQLVTRV